MKTQNKLTVFFLIFFLASSAKASVLFEGWFEVFLASKKVGYLVERVEFENNQFKATKYLRTNSTGNNVTESLKAFSAADLTPIKYSYTSKVGESVKVIDAFFKGDVMTLQINDGQKMSKESKRIKKGTFLSEFMIYLILSQNDPKSPGLSVGKDYSFNAIAEEDGTVHTGSAYVKNEEEVRGRKAFRILNEFKGEKFFTWVTAKGESLLYRNPSNNIEVKFSENKAQATKDMMVNQNDLKLLFGRIPGDEGGSSLQSPPEEKQMIDEKKKKLFEKNEKPNPGKGAVPQGQNIMIKGAPPPPPPAEPKENKPKE